MDALRTARHFPPVYIDTHPLVGIRHNAEGFKEIHGLPQVVLKVGTLHRFYKAQIEVALIVVHSPATGKTARQRDIVRAQIRLIRFLPYTLVLAYHHRRGGLPHHKEIIFLFLEKVLFRRQIEIHIRTAVIYAGCHANSVS